MDILINIDYFETENGHFSQTGDNFDVYLHDCPSVGIWYVLFAHLLCQNKPQDHFAPHPSLQESKLPRKNLKTDMNLTSML
jgi:hypothetical protein